MGWLIKIDTVEYTDAVFDHIEENLNGHIEAAFTLPNNDVNRTLVNADHTVEILYNDGAATTSEFTGILRAPEFQQSGLLCKCYQTCYEQMQRKVHTGNYDAITPDVILAAIASSAGVLVGACPTTPTLSVRYDKAYCYDAARFIAWVLGKDLYPDFSGASPRINIGTAGTGYPSGRGLLQYTTVPKRGKDRAKKRDKVYIRGLDASGLPLVGEAGTGTEVAVFTDRTATDQATINALAAKKLADLNVEASGCIVPTTLESPIVAPAYVQGYDVHAGDYVILNCAELDYASSVVRVIKVTKRLTDAEVEVEKAELLLDDYLEEIEQWESLGIFAPVTAPDIDPVTPSGFGTDDVVPASIQNTDGTFVTLFAVTVHRVTGMSGYKVRWQKKVNGEGTIWNYADIEQPASGDAVLYTAPVAMGTTYYLQVASFNMDEKVSAYTASVAKVATTDTSAPAVPAGVAATTSGLIRAIKVSWTAVTSADLKGYKVYRYTSNTPGSAIEIARTGATVIIIDTDLVTPYYFWVSSYDFIGNESAKSTLATGCPVTGQKEVITDVTDVIPAVPVIACLAQEVDTSGEFRTWIQVTITRVTNAGGYVVSYKKTVDAQWTHYYVEQPSSGDPIAVTPSLDANTSYDIHACSVSPKGQASAWSTTQVIVTTANTTAPPVPTGLVPTAVVDGVMLEWNPVTATDFSYYRVYYGTTNPPLNVAGQTSRPYFLWTKDTVETYQLYYFAITAVDNAGNESAKCTAVSATPTQIVALDIAPNAVEAAAILAGAVTEAKIAADAVADSKIQTAAIRFVTSRVGEVLDFPFDEGTGITTRDLSEYENNGTIYGASWVDGKYGKALSFDGINDYVEALDSTSLNITGDKLTVSLWVKMTNKGGVMGTILGKGKYKIFGYDAPAWDPSLLDTYMFGVTIAGIEYYSPRFIMNQYETWHHIVGVYDGAYLSLYIDGVLRGTPTARTGNIQSSAGIPLRIQEDVLLDIDVDEARVYNRALSAEEVKTIYRLGGVQTNIPVITSTLIKSNAVIADKIAAGAVTAEKLTVASIYLTGLVLTNNSPSAGYVAWSACTLVYEGVAYAIAAGNSNYPYIHWTKPGTTFIASGTKPAWAADRYMIVYNSTGTAILLWNATYIHGGTLITGTITAQDIQTACLTADRIAAGTITGTEADRILVDGSVKTAKILNLNADKVLIDGVVYLSSWRKGSDLTKIDGGYISTGTVDTLQLNANAVKTAKIELDDLSSEPSGVRKLWYWGAKDYLCFKGNAGVVGYIPRYPLFDIQAPPENMVPNQAFEIDRDGDGVPDYWTKTYSAGSPFYEWSIAYSWKGQHSLRMSCDPGDYLVFDCVWIPILPNKKYFFGVDIYANVAATFGYGIGVVEFWNAAKSAVVGAIGFPASVVAGWNHPTAEGTTPSTARWALIKLYNYNPNVWVDLYFDNVVFSEMRSAVPTAGVVATATQLDFGSNVSCGTAGFTLIRSLAVPNVDHDVLFVRVTARRSAYDKALFAMVKVTVDSVDYPSADGLYITGVPYIPALGTSMFPTGFATITLPFNANGKTLNLYLKSLDETANFQGRFELWGHSPHTHR